MKKVVLIPGDGIGRNNKFDGAFSAGAKVG